MNTRKYLGNKVFNMGLKIPLKPGETPESPTKLGEQFRANSVNGWGNLAGDPWISPGFLIGAATKYFLALRC